jgi:hypothetical protein
MMLHRAGFFFKFIKLEISKRTPQYMTASRHPEHREMPF